MKIDVQIGMGKHECKVCIDGIDISNRLKEITINKSGSTIPEVVMKFVPDECKINLDCQFITLDKELNKYSIDELSNEVGKRISRAIQECIT